MTKTDIKQAIILENFDTETADQIWVELANYPNEMLSAEETNEFIEYIKILQSNNLELITESEDFSAYLEDYQQEISQLEASADDEIAQLYENEINQLGVLVSEVKGLLQATSASAIPAANQPSTPAISSNTQLPSNLPPPNFPAPPAPPVYTN